MFGLSRPYPLKLLEGVDLLVPKSSRFHYSDQLRLGRELVRALLDGVPRQGGPRQKRGGNISNLTPFELQHMLYCH